MKSVNQEQWERDHAYKLSDGFIQWLDEAPERQKRERQERKAEIRERLFPERETMLTPMDEVIHSQGSSANYYGELSAWKRKAGEKLFPERETDRRREEKTENRHPMDDFIRAQLAEKKRKYR